MYLTKEKAILEGFSFLQTPIRIQRAYRTDSLLQYYHPTEKFNNGNAQTIIKRLKNMEENRLGCDIREVLPNGQYLTQIYLSLAHSGLNIETLLLEHEQIQPEILQIASIKNLVIYGKNTTTLPDYLSELPKLEWLNTIDFRLDKIPDCVFSMSNLKALQLKTKSANKQLARLFTALPSLELFEFNNSGIKSLPEEINAAKQLRYLILDGNTMEKLPDSFRDLTSIELLAFTYKPNDAENKLIFPTQLTNASFFDDENQDISLLHDNLGQIKSLKSSLKTLIINADTLPAFPNLEELFIYTHHEYKEGDTQTIQTKSVLPSLKKLIFSGKIGLSDLNFLQFDGLEHLEQAHYTRIDFAEISDLFNLKTLKLHASEPRAALPNYLHTLEKLEEIQLQNDYHYFWDISNCGTLPALKSVKITGVALGAKAFLQQNPQLEQLEIHSEEPLLEVFSSLSNLKKLSCSTQVLGDELPLNVSIFSALENLEISFSRKKQYNNLGQFLQAVGALPKLKSLKTYQESMPEHKDWVVLNHFPELDFIVELGYGRTKSSLALTPKAILQFNGKFDGFDKEQQARIEAFLSLKDTNLNDIQRVIALALVQGDSAYLRTYVANSLPKTLKKGSIVYLMGRMQGLSAKQAKEQLSNKGIEISASLKPSVTHIVLGDGLSMDKVIPALKMEKNLALAEHLTDWLNQPEDFFMLQVENADMTTTIIPLLLNTDWTNHQLALAMMQGGGVSPRLIPYLLIFQGLHPDKDIRKDARTLYKRFAPAKMQDHFKRVGWKSMKGVLSEWQFKPEHINYWDAALALQQFRNQITAERQKNEWVFGWDFPNTLVISSTNIRFIDEMPVELNLIDAHGIIVKDYAQGMPFDEFFERLLAIPKQFPQLGKVLYFSIGTLSEERVDALREAFDKVVFSDHFKMG